MADEPLRTALHHLRRLLNSAEAAGVSDAQLVERFVTARDEAAFELLVRRHERLVLNVCRRVLHDGHDAEDAFQATFLVFVRKVAAIGKRASVAGWLYQVAYRIALRARTASARRAANEKLSADLPALAADPGPDAAWRELRPLLDQEVSRLPEKYRLPVILCYLQSRTYEEAARELGCSRGTLSTRLTRARELLRRRLVRRGLTLSGGLLATLLVEETATAAPPAGLADAVVRAAATGVVPANVVSLTEGALHAMLLTKFKQVVAGTVVAAAVAGLGTGALLYRPAAAQTPAASSPPAQDERRKEEPVISGLDRSPRPEPPPLPEARRPPAGPTTALRERIVLSTGKDLCMAVAFTPDGQLLATAGRNGSVRFWDVASGKEVRHLITGGHLYSIAFSRTGHLLATGGGERGKAGEARLWDPASGKEMESIRGRADLITSVAFSPDGRALAYGSRDGTVTLWDTAQRRKWVDSVGAAASVFGVAVSPDGKLLATAGGEEFVQPGRTRGDLRLWDVATGKELATVGGHTGTVTSVAFSPDGRTLASGGFDYAVSLWDVSTGKERMRMHGDAAIVRCVAFSPDGRTLASGSFNGSVSLWDARTGKQTASLKGPGDGVMSVAFSPDGRLLAAAGGTDTVGRVVVWEVAGEPARPPAAGPIGRLDRLLDELLKSNRSDDQIIEALYLATLARLPAEQEKKHMVEQVAGRKRREGFKDGLWALLNSNEFHERLKEWNSLHPESLGEFLKRMNEAAPETGGRKARVLRWKLGFNTQSGDEYLRQLRGIRPGGGAILGVPTTDGKFEVLRDLSKRPAAGKVEGLTEIKQIFWMDDKPESVAGLAHALGIPAPRYFVVLFPPDLEDELIRLEREKAKELFPGAREEDIDETQFDVVPSEDGYRARAVSVHLK
jgi:RNA polymerase sigma factor (sigma-70 family)